MRGELLLRPRPVVRVAEPAELADLRDVVAPRVANQDVGARAAQLDHVDGGSDLGRALAVDERQDGPERARVEDRAEIELADDEHLLVGIALGEHAVAREGEVAGGEDGRLPVVERHRRDHGERAHRAGVDDVHLVLDGARLGAVAHAQEPLAVVGAARDDEDVGLLARGGPHDFRELDVVADRDGQAAERRVEHPQRRPWRDLPIVLLEPRHVQLALRAHRAVRAEHEALVVDGIGAVVRDGDRARHDVHAEARGEPAHRVAKSRRLSGEIADLLAHRAAHVAEREQLHGEVLGEHDELAPVVGRGLDEALHLRLEVFERPDRPDEVLQGGDANAPAKGSVAHDAPVILPVRETMAHETFSAAAGGVVRGDGLRRAGGRTGPEPSLRSLCRGRHFPHGRRRRLAWHRPFGARRDSATGSRPDSRVEVDLTRAQHERSIAGGPLEGTASGLFGDSLYHFGEGRTQIFVVGSVGVLNSEITQTYPVAGGTRTFTSDESDLAWGGGGRREGLSDATALAATAVPAGPK